MTRRRFICFSAQVSLGADDDSDPSRPTALNEDNKIRCLWAAGTARVKVILGSQRCCDHELGGEARARFFSVCEERRGAQGVVLRAPAQLRAESLELRLVEADVGDALLDVVDVGAHGALKRAFDHLNL